MGEPEETGETTDSDPYNVDLAGFIDDHTALFLVMGVFAALAVYIAQTAPQLGSSTDAALTVSGGYVAALGMAILILALVYKELVSLIGSAEDLFYAHFRFKNVPLFFFSLFNLMLIFSLGQLIYRYEPAMFMIVVIGAFFYTGGFMYRVLRDLRGKLGEALSENAKVVFPALFVVSTAFFLASYSLLTGYLSDVEIRTIHELSLSNPVPIGITIGYLLLTTVLSVSAGGMLASLVAMPLLALKWLLSKLWKIAQKRGSRADIRNDN